MPINGACNRKNKNDFLNEYTYNQKVFSLIFPFILAYNVYN